MIRLQPHMYGHTLYHDHYGKGKVTKAPQIGVGTEIEVTFDCGPQTFVISEGLTVNPLFWEPIKVSALVSDIKGNKIGIIRTLFTDRTIPETSQLSSTLSSLMGKEVASVELLDGDEKSFKYLVRTDAPFGASEVLIEILPSVQK